jgi:hypothetical protein
MKNNSTQYTSCMVEHMKAHMLEVHMAMTWNHFLIQKPSAFDYGTDGLCGGGVWGSSQLDDHSKQPS